MVMIARVEHLKRPSSVVSRSYMQILDKAVASVFSWIFSNLLSFYGLRVEHLPANIRQGWRGLPGTNSLAYFEKS
jgi:hypothetical protein